MKARYWILLMILEAALLTNPRLSDHTAAVAGVYASGELQQVFGFGAEFLVKRHNYIFFSTASVKGITISYGAFGYVKPLPIEL